MGAERAELIDEFIKGANAAHDNMSRLDEIYVEKVQVLREMIDYLAEIEEALKH